jgi:hypothetical protein
MNEINTGEIILYQPDNSIQLEVRIEDETVWLSQMQMAELFDTTKQNVSLHINNIFKEGELEKKSTVKDYLTVQQEGERSVQRTVSFYNLDVIISVGYRIKSRPATLFRIRATKILKTYLLKGYTINPRFERLEQRVSETEQKIDFFVKTSLPPAEGIFYDGQIFDAYAFVSNLIKQAKQSIVLIDNYVDEKYLTPAVQTRKKRDSNSLHGTNNAPTATGHTEAQRPVPSRYRQNLQPFARPLPDRRQRRLSHRRLPERPWQKMVRLRQNEYPRKCFTLTGLNRKKNITR